MSNLAERSSGTAVERRRDLVAAVREATHAEHAAIEACLGGLVDRALTLAAYRRIIERFHGYYLPLELALHRSGQLAAIEAELPWPARSERLARDIAALGGTVAAELPSCRLLPAVDSPAAALGCSYVVEGAALGGQVIAHHVTATLGVSPERGAAFFFGDGDRTRARWSLFAGILARFGASHPEAHPQVIGAAVATFQTFRCWCDGAAT